MVNELGPLTKGVLPDMLTGTETMHFIAMSEMPRNKTTAYLRVVAAEKPNKAEKRRIRCTMGGDKIHYDGPIGTQPPTSLPSNVCSTALCQLPVLSS